jgi:hypothetical protein
MPYCWEENKSEIEFLKTIKNYIVPIEVKSGHKTYSKSLNSFTNRYSPKFPFRLSKNNFSLQNKIKDIPIYAAEFLEDIIY